MAAPAPVSTPSCWTEQETVWDTQYVDQVTMECSPVTKVGSQQRQINIFLDCIANIFQQVPQRVSKSVAKQVCDDGGSYGAQSSPVQSAQGGGGGGYSGGGGGGANTVPRGKTRSGADRLRLRTGSAAAPDAVNFGK